VNGSTTVTNVYNPNNLNQLQQSTAGGQTLKYWYDSLGRQQCVTDANGSQANCNPSENSTASTDLVSDNRYDYSRRFIRTGGDSAGGVEEGLS
jgi:YD repeat-containing protein